MNEALRNLLERRSVRTYQSRQLSDADLDAILEAGTYAPSAMGKQPALMAVVQDPALIAQLSRMNAQFTDDPTSDPFYGAPSVILVFADTARPTWIQDGSLVMGNLMNAAHAVGVGSCWINRAFQMFSTDEGKALKEKWGVGESFSGIGCCILGYCDGPLPAPKPRKDGFVIRV